ncbi:MAG: hypothetical protein KIT31_25245 [Deltaproteobacteria bacterium]|nr:hypothetical protein [Deltaproteobacteria bacterium]
MEEIIVPMLIAGSVGDRRGRRAVAELGHRRVRRRQVVPTAAAAAAAAGRVAHLAVVIVVHKNRERGRAPPARRPS